MRATSRPPAGDEHPDVLRAIAAHGLAGTMLDLPARALDDREFLGLNSRVRSQKLSGLLWSAIEDGAFPVTPSQRERAEQSHIQVLCGVLQLEHLLLRTVEQLAGAGIPYRALKGAAVAHQDYARPGDRVFGDVDVLVPGEHFDDAVAVLCAAGCRRRFPEPRPGFDRRFGKGTCLVTSDGLELDLHRTFAIGSFGERLAIDEIWRRRDGYSLAGVVIDTLPPEERLMHAAYHTVLGDRQPRLIPMRDVAQIALTRSLDWQHLRQLMRASAGEAVVARAVRMSWRALELADVLLISAWAHDYADDKRAQAEIALYDRSASYAARSFGTIRAIPTLSRKARYLTALAMPDRSYLENRHSGHVDRWRRGLREISEARGRS